MFRLENEAKRKKLETCTWMERETSLRFGGLEVHKFDLKWRMIEEVPAYK